MTALEIREFRNTCKKLIEAEERDKLLKNRFKNKVGLSEDEYAIHSSNQKIRSLNNKGGVLNKKHDEI